MPEITVTDRHADLSGLTADDHPQYLLLAGREGQTIEDVLRVLVETAETAVPVEAARVEVETSGTPAVGLGPETRYEVNGVDIAALVPFVNGASGGAATAGALSVYVLDGGSLVEVFRSAGGSTQFFRDGAPIQFVLSREDIANGVNVGTLTFQGKSSTGVNRSYGILDVIMTSNANGSETAVFRCRVQRNGALNEPMRIHPDGLAVGTSPTSLNAAAALEVVSTTRGVLFPRMTTAQRDAISSPPDGLMVYNTTTNKFQGRAGGSWVDLH